MAFVPDDYEAIGSCVLNIDPVKTRDCEISTITVLIWDRVLQLATLGLLLGYAKDFAAGMGFHHLVVKKVGGLVEGILRIIGWDDCGCGGWGGDREAGLCGRSLAAEQEFRSKEDGQTRDNDQPEGNGQTEEIDGMDEESGSGNRVLKVEESAVTNDQARRKITLDELIEAAAQDNWDLVIGTRKRKRRFDELEPAAPNETSNSKRDNIEFNGCCNNVSGCVRCQPASLAPRVPPLPTIKAPSLPISDDLSLVKNEKKSPRVRGSRGRGDPRNHWMKLEARRGATKATKRLTSSAITTASERLPLLQKGNLFENYPIEHIGWGLGIPEVTSGSSPDIIGSSMLEVPPHHSSVPTVSGNSALLPTALNSGEPIDSTLNSTGYDRDMLDDSGSVRQQREAKLVLEVQALMDKFQQQEKERFDHAIPAQRPEIKVNLGIQAFENKVQRDDGGRIDPSTKAMRDLNVQSPPNAILVSDHRNESAKGDGNTSRTSHTILNTSGKESICPVMMSHVPKNAKVNDSLKRPAGLKADEVVRPEQLKDSPPLTEISPKPSRETWLGSPVVFRRAARPGSRDLYRPRY